MKNATLFLSVFMVILVFAIGFKEKTKITTSVIEAELDSIEADTLDEAAINMATISKNKSTVDRKQATKDYIKKYKAAAIAEMRKHQIPASITLAQGLLESNLGLSSLAVRDNNHFGIKCKACCIDCLCRNYEDDDKCDMFRVFSSAAESYAEHSKLLNQPRYKYIKRYGKDYKRWAKELKKAGYATDKTYAEKLIRIIEANKLYRYDR